MARPARARLDPLESDASDRLAHLVKDAGKALSRALQRRIEGVVAYGHWTFLRILWRGDGVSLAALSAIAGVAAPSMTAAVRAMEALGYVERRQRGGDRKRVYVHLTALGRSLEPVLTPMAVAVNDIAMQGYAGQDVRLFRDMLLGVIDNLERDRANA